jgi:hypothetical protein
MCSADISLTASLPLGLPTGIPSHCAAVQSLSIVVALGASLSVICDLKICYSQSTFRYLSFPPLALPHSSLPEFFTSLSPVFNLNWFMHTVQWHGAAMFLRVPEKVENSWVVESLIDFQGALCSVKRMSFAYLIYLRTADVSNSVYFTWWCLLQARCPAFWHDWMILCLLNDFFMWLHNVVLIIWLSMNNELERIQTASGMT